MRKLYGRIELFMGPMFSGKTKSMIGRIHELVSEENLSCYAVKYYKDNRYGEANELRTHDGQ